MDKSLGISSNLALQKTKRLFQANKAGHTGSLDPLATGMLPICFGEATKFSQFLLDANKRYTTVAKLGIKTTTGDAEGEIVKECAVPLLTVEQLNHILEKFRGEIKQVPSMYSALKHQGKALYKYAREGQIIERPARDIVVHALTLNAYQDNFLTLDVYCSKGTYVRNLVEDIGDMIGCGAHVVKLHRTQVANLPAIMHSLAQAEAILAQLSTVDEKVLQENNLLLPVDILVKSLPSMVVTDRQSVDLLQGKIVQLEETQLNDLTQDALIDVPLALYSQNTAKFIGIGVLNTELLLRAKRMMSQTHYDSNNF